MKKIYYFSGIVVFISIVQTFVLCHSTALAAQFSAIIVISSGIETAEVSQYKVYVKDDKHSLKQLDSITPPLIVDRNSDVVWAVYHRTKQYSEIEKEKASIFDPILFVEMIPKLLKAERKYEAKETVNGYECDKYAYYYLSPEKETQGFRQKAIEVWISKKLNHFIKAIYHWQNGDVIVEFRNIREGPIDDALVNVPAGYAKLE